MAQVATPREVLVLDTEAGEVRTSLGGEIRALVEEVFIIPRTPGVDFLFVIDDSRSMREEQDGLRANLQAFLQYVQAQALDFRIAVTTPSRAQAGRFVPLGAPAEGRVIAAGESDVETRFMALTSVGTSAPDDGLGLWAVLEALSAPRLAAENRGLLREDAALSIIVVSDRGDRSEVTVDEALHRLGAIKGFRNTRSLVFNAIVGCPFAR